MLPDAARTSWTRAALALSVGTFVWLYAHVFVKLIHDWATDGNYSHGFLIVPIAAYLAWERRAAIARLELRPSYVGLGVVLASLLLMVAGTLGAELFLTRLSMLGVLAGAILFVAGWARLRALAFPLAFLLLMIPIPAIIFNRVVFPLQLVASQFGTQVLSVAGIPVLREGNVIILARTSLEVAEACSGIRSLISLLTLGIVFGYFIDGRRWVRATIALSTIPITIITNGLRVAGMGVVAQYYGVEAAEGFLHAFSGWLVFALAMMMLIGLQRLVAAVRPTIGSGAALAPAGS
jgi:exosortase